ncbi:MAG: hypothetical protein H6907_21185 [Hyphomicrobiales bacterium]|nr:hypothetical protein [Hyphomicrobiales bacterium]MCP5374258.1 hypothetical protein [Hyphomicrobiales bacterium]
MGQGSDGAAIVHDKQMGFSRTDFVRTLPRVFGPDACQVAGDRATWSDGAGRRVEIEMGPERERRIALIRLPYMDVRLRLTGFTDAEAAAFMVRFDRSYQRGGG